MRLVSQKRALALTALPFAIIALVAAFLVAAPATAEKGGKGKEVICHRPPGNPDNAHEIEVGVAAVPAHLAHGDTVGTCRPGA